MTGRYVETFMEEAHEILGRLEVSLLELEKNPSAADLIDSVFRDLHTLKGSGGMAGFDAVADFVHEIETVFDIVRDGRLSVGRELIDLTLSARDHVAWLIEEGPTFSGVDSVAGRIVSAIRVFLPTESEERTADEKDSNRKENGTLSTFRIVFKPNRDIFSKGLNPLPLLDELRRLGDCSISVIAEEIPNLDEIDPELCYVGWEITLVTSSDINAVRDVFIFFEDDADLLIEPLGMEGIPAGTDHLSESSIPLEDEKVNTEAPNKQERGTQGSIRVRAEKIDSLVNLIGELVTVQARLSQIAGNRNDPEILAVAEEVERLTGNLRDEVLDIRMLPIGLTFGKFKRLVRDLSDEVGKEIRLVTDGGATELDKTVIDRLQDPLVHLIRNSIDHGIETPDVRIGRNKPSFGTVFLSASHSGATVRIEIRDDGSGLDTERIRAKAIERGLIDSETQFSEKDIHNLIFLPGFSTASEVTNLSGRGVGLDVLRQSIEELRGSIEVASALGEGTAFILKLPLTLAIIDGLLVRVGEELFVMPLSAVEECVELKRSEREKAGERHLANVRGEIVPYVRLRDRFRISGALPESELIVIAGNDGHRVGFIVDDVVGTYQTVIKSLGKVYQNVSGLSGATILGDGRVALILDLPAIVKGSALEEAAAAA